MNQLSVAQKRFPNPNKTLAADYFALRKSYQGTRWIFSETRKLLNPASHCDIAWRAPSPPTPHGQEKFHRCAVGYDSCWFDGRTITPTSKPNTQVTHHVSTFHA